MKKDNKMFFKSIKHRFSSDYDNMKEATILLEECNHLADIVNTTSDENEFYKSYDKLIENFTELTTYEGIIPFTNKPSSDLRNIIANRQAAIKRFNRRANANPIYIEDADPLFLDAVHLVVENQQAHIGKSLYYKDIAVVLTNQYFTQQAQEEANALGVKLWDRNKLEELINNQ